MCRCLRHYEIAHRSDIQGHDEVQGSLSIEPRDQRRFGEGSLKWSICGDLQPMLVTTPPMFAITLLTTSSVAEFQACLTTPHNDPLDDETFDHTPSQPHKELNATINNFMARWCPRMQELVEKAEHVPSLLPLWDPGPSANPNLARHISELCIPAIDRLPSLLLHNLGELKNSLKEGSGTVNMVHLSHQ